jgi:hypothetical protein
MQKLLQWCCLGLVLLGCGAGAQKPAIAMVMGNDKRRHDSVEAMLRVLDEHPQYVDEFLIAAQRHPVALDRLLRDTAHALSRDEFARFVAKRLVTDPAGLELTLIATLDESSDKPAALHAIAGAMAARPQLAAIVVVQTDASLRGTLRALLQEVLKNPDARRSFLLAISENSDAMARIIAPNPEVMAALIKSFARVGVHHADKEIAALVKALE